MKARGILTRRLDQYVRALPDVRGRGRSPLAFFLLVFALSVLDDRCRGRDRAVAGATGERASVHLPGGRDPRSQIERYRGRAGPKTLARFRYGSRQG